MSDTLTLARPWGGHPAGAVLGTSAAAGVVVVDGLRLRTLREHGFASPVGAASEEPAAAATGKARRRGRTHG